MEWIVAFFNAFETEFDTYPETVQDAILAKLGLLEREAPGSVVRMLTRSQAPSMPT